MKNPPAVLIITYQRVEKFSHILDQCIKFGIKKIYIAIDDSSITNPELTKAYETTIAKHDLRSDVKISLWIRETNLGLGVSIITAIDWFFKTEDSGIILEDDLEFTKSSFEFLQKSLEFFRSNKSIFMISGSQFFKNIGPMNGISLGNYPLVWGWATWKSRWDNFRSAIDNPLEIFPKTNIPIRVKYFWYEGFHRSLLGKTNSWAVLLATYVRFNNLYCIYPNQNLISNTGFENFATHTKKEKWPLGLPVSNNFDVDLNSILLPELNRQLERDLYRIRFIHILFFFSCRKNRKFIESKGTPYLVKKIRDVKAP
jgi:hypothetical protein